MVHAALYSRVNGKLRFVAGFMVFMGVVSVGISFLIGSPKIALNVFKLVAIGICAYYLIEGKQWALCVMLIVAVASTIQGLLGLIQSSGGLLLIYYVPVTIVFGYIVYLLMNVNNKEFHQYAELRHHGYSASPQNQLSFHDIVDVSKVVEFTPSEVSSSDDYIRLMQEIFRACEMPDFEKIVRENNKFLLEDAQRIYEIHYNPNLRSFDRSVLEGVNGVLSVLNSPLRIHTAWKESIIGEKTNVMTLVCVDDSQYIQLRDHGYVKDRSTATL